MDDRYQGLIEAATAAREHAYVPYSGFKVGAALLADSGRVYGGCNVENASFGLSCCAERNAVFAAVGAGERRIVAAAVVTATTMPTPPCGACRQVLLEFAGSGETGKDMDIALVTLDGAGRLTTLSALLPDSFDHFDLPGD